jgi:hypothetical protein
LSIISDDGFGSGFHGSIRQDELLVLYIVAMMEKSRKEMKRRVPLLNGLCSQFPEGDEFVHLPWIHTSDDDGFGPWISWSVIEWSEAIMPSSLSTGTE